MTNHNLKGQIRVGEFAISAKFWSSLYIFCSWFFDNFSVLHRRISAAPKNRSKVFIFVTFLQNIVFSQKPFFSRFRESAPTDQPTQTRFFCRTFFPIIIWCSVGGNTFFLQIILFGLKLFCGSTFSFSSPPAPAEPFLLSCFRIYRTLFTQQISK